MKNIIVIKIGGIASQRLSDSFLKQVKTWQSDNKNIIIVHGGGYAIDQLMTEAKFPIKTCDGLRITEEKVIPLISSALLDIVGPNLITSLNNAGLKTEQFTDSLKYLIQADFISKENYGYVGEVSKVSTVLLEKTLKQGKIPIIASLGYTTNGQPLNINADYLATAIATSVKATQLILLTDVPGVLENGQLISNLTTKQSYQKIKEGVIKDGMIPKVQSATKTILLGVDSIMIANQLEKGTIITKENL